jgi:hypothetical protein
MRYVVLPAGLLAAIAVAVALLSIIIAPAKSRPPAPTPAEPEIVPVRVAEPVVVRPVPPKPEPPPVIPEPPPKPADPWTDVPDGEIVARHVPLAFKVSVELYNAREWRVYLRVENRSQVKIIRHLGWKIPLGLGGELLKIQEPLAKDLDFGVARLTDEFGNDYDFEKTFVDQGEIVELYPGKSGGEMFRFPMPVDRAETLYLTLPGGRIGQLEALRFRIPTKLFRPKAEAAPLPPAPAPAPPRGGRGRRMPPGKGRIIPGVLRPGG